MIPLIFISQILIQAIFQYKHSMEGLIVLTIALAFCTAIAQARWCAIWAKHDDLDIRLERLEKKEKRGK